MTLVTDYTKLPLPDRIKLVGEIWDSIAADAPESFGLSPMQKEELDRRVAEHRTDPPKRLCEQTGDDEAAE